jgi:hypothetical protein
MTLSKQLRRSFAGGEITPEMFGRIDLGKNQTGLQLARNFRTTPHGPATRRPGFVYNSHTRGSVYTPDGSTTHGIATLIPFVFAADQAIILEFGDFYVRFHNSSGTILETSLPVVSVTAGVFNVAAHGWSTGDWVFADFSVSTIPSIGNRFYLVVVVDANNVSLMTLDKVAVSTTGLPAYAAGGTLARVYQIATPYDAASAAELTFAQNSDVLTLTHGQGLFQAQELRRSGATSWALTPVSFAPVITAPTGLAATPTHPVAGNPTTASYVVTAVAGDLVSESVASAVATASNDLTLAGNFNTLTWGAVAIANRYYVYKLRGGAYGYIGQTTTLTLKDDNILPDTTVVPPEANITLNTVATQYPSTVTYHEQRRWFGGTLQKPQTIWGTRSATESNLTSSIPSRDDDGMEFRIAAQQQNAIRHLLPLTDMIALTAGGEFRIFADGAPAITPTSLSIKPQGFTGAAPVMPALTSGSILYVQTHGSRVRELAYDPSGTGYFRSIDITLLAPHLFDGFTITSLAYSRSPDQVLWAVRSDGVLLGLSYVPEQQVYGWHQHTTNGAFESIAVIPEDGEDVLYAVVRRSALGPSPRTVRYIERLHTRILTSLADAFYVDSGLSYSGVAQSTFTGLWHLEGMTVDILADGAVQAQQVVTNGAVTLDTPASNVHIGLNYISDMQTLPLTLDGAMAGGMGTIKNVNKLHLRLTQSSLVRAGPSLDKLSDYPARMATDPYDSPESLRNGEISIVVAPNWNTDGSIYVRQDRPLPLTVASITFEVASGG